ncbi:hypothetical protein HAX54_048124 [Datura stramonium]|uniref:DUF4283 domain-containing protein n=1 Tax=Datura stramonium TaxID=4076 RepID=A0ABS8STE1_DATST|nr:hypothetical protein [Datura stramonium]
MIDGTPVVKWTKAKVTRMNIMENLQYAVVGKFSYRWPKIDELRCVPTQCGIKGDCRIGVLRNRHILIRFALVEDFVNLMAKTKYYIKDKTRVAFQMRPLIYDSHFKVGRETTQEIAWISFPNLLPPSLARRRCSHWPQLLGNQFI